QLPRLLDVQGEDTNGLRASACTDAAGVTTWLLMNLDEVARSARLGDQPIHIAPGQLLALRRDDAAWRTLHAFAPDAITANRVHAPTLALTGWQARWDGAEWLALERPLAAYQLVKHAPIGAQPLLMPITGWAAHDGTVVAETMEYRATLQVPSPVPKHLTLVLEPTAQRGALRVQLGARSWEVVMADIGEAPTRIELADAVVAGTNELRITVIKPMSLDGIKWAPEIVVG
ncbi:MAG: hypothetical protein H0W72_06475, partial [Planctomycetes bacterium]|nr:hypothetical protein [Planctomycetota bacterium]